MGEWSEYFEDFPEENQANYLNGHFNPEGAKANRDAEQKLRSNQGSSQKTGKIAR